jgi:8-oxo-dGTP pyrophosphatase MutT (NUDIX family)
MARRQNPWKTLSSREVYQNPGIRVREDRVIRPDGKPGIYGVVESPGGVGIVALDSEKRVILVGQWRYTLKRYSWEVPTGGKHHNETFLAAAKRELKEETGLRARQWKAMGTVDNSNSATDEVGAVFFARELTRHGAKPFVS